MGVFSKVFKSRDSSRVRNETLNGAAKAAAAQGAKWEDAWSRKSVAPEEVQELLNLCTQEVKSRALEVPFLLLPFRPTSDLNGTKLFIRNFFKGANGTKPQYDSQELYHELKLIDPLVLCSIMKWCWSRLSGGVVTWNTYELFRVGELDSNMAKHAFDTFIPLSASSEAHKRIIFDFFDLLAATAANGKSNGLGGRKLSRLAGWWAFDHPDEGKGFNTGYKSWASAADATSHLFFAYLRCLAPDGKPGTAGVSKLPRSLQALLSQTEYPPQTPELLLCRSSKVVMLVDSVSPTPYALLRRAKNFEYRDEDPILQQFAEFSDPIAALTPECRRVLEAISLINTTGAKSPERDVSSPRPDASWSRFEDIGFSSLLDDPESTGDTASQSYSRLSGSDGLRPSGGSGNMNLGRPATPSWADFLSSGFSDDASTAGAPSLLLPPDQILPPLSPARVHSSQSHVKGGLKGDNLEPGELASVNYLDLDETFWWVWISSLAAEETAERKGVFGRCAFIETDITGGRWLIMEEQVKGAEVTADEGMFVLEKKNRFSSFTKRGRTRRSSAGKRPPVPNVPYQQKSATLPQSRTTIGPDQHAKVQAAAAALVQQKKDEQDEMRNVGRRRARTDEYADSKTTSVMTLQPVIMKEAGPAMQWARKFDKETIRQQYLGDNMAGKGMFRESSPTSSNLNLPTSMSAGEATALAGKEQTREIAEPVAAFPTTQQSTSPPPPPPEPTAALPVEAAPASLTRDVPLSTQPEPVETPSVPLHQSTPSSASQQATAIPQTPVRSTVERKPVGSVDSTSRSNPSYRKPSVSETQPLTSHSKKGSDQSPAAIAAKVAAGGARPPSQPRSPETQKTKAAVLQKSPKGSSRGFKGMFNRKKVAGPSAPATGQTTANGSALSAEQPKLSRTPSFLRRKAVADAQAASQAATQASAPQRAAPAPSEPEPEVASVPVLASEPADIEGGEPGPVVMTDSNDYQDPTPLSNAAMISPEANDSSARFSDFSQGPLEDAPADLESEEPEGSVTPKPIPQPTSSSGQQFNTLAAARLAPDQNAPLTSRPDSAGYATSATGYDTAKESASGTDDADTVMADDEESLRDSFAPAPAPTTSSVPPSSTAYTSDPSPALAPAPVLNPVPEPVAAPPPMPENEAADRWAQIKKNAAERKTSADQAPRTRTQNQSQSESVQTDKTDDGETSGEESIESRVARIKARVLELTGPGGQQQPAPERTAAP